VSVTNPYINYGMKICSLTCLSHSWPNSDWH